MIIWSKYADSSEDADSVQKQITKTINVQSKIKKNSTAVQTAMKLI